jgi:hypothetical protein
VLSNSAAQPRNSKPDLFSRHPRVAITISSRGSEVTIMTGLLSLSAELIYAIFDQLQPVDEVHPIEREEKIFDPPKIRDYVKSKATLANLARTCKFLQPIATKSLFKYQWLQYLHPHPAVLRRVMQEPAIRQTVKHKRILEDGSRSEYKGRSRDEIRTHLSQFPVLHQDDVERVLRHDLCDLEVAILVAQVPNLETFEMDVTYRGYRRPNNRSSLSIWLWPIVEAGRRISNDPSEHHDFTRLHAINIIGQSLSSPDLAYLFCLPRLRRLQINSVVTDSLKEAAPVPWPVIYARSNLRELALTDVEAPAIVIAHMVRSCKALQVFTCRRPIRGDWFDDDMPTELRAWCLEILLALEEHTESLEILELQPRDEPLLQHELSYCYQPLDGFRKLNALQVLVVPIHLLIGRPPRTTETKSTQPITPLMRHVIPPNLTHLSLSMRPSTSPAASANTILDCMPANDANEEEREILRNVQLRYEQMLLDFPLSLNFWEIERSFRQRGVDFVYVIIDAIDFDYGEDDWNEEQLDAAAHRLSAYGVKGLEMAGHFAGFEEPLVKRISKILGFEEDKVPTYEESEMMILYDEDVAAERWGAA